MRVASPAGQMERRVLPLGVSIALSLFGDLTLFAVLVTQLDATGLTLPQVGVILSVHRLIRIPGNLLVGALQNVFGRRPLFLAGMFLAVASTAAYSLVSGFWPLLLARLAWGSAWALLNVSGTTIVLDLSGEHNRGSLTGFYNAWVWVGYFISPLAGGLLVDRLGFHPAMAVLAALTAIGLLVALWQAPETLPPSGRSRTPSAGAFLASLAETLDLRRNGFALNRTLLVFAVVVFTGDGIVLSTLTLLLTERLGQVIQAGGLVLSATAAGGIFVSARAVLAIFASVVSGRLSDRSLKRATVTAGGLALCLASFAVMLFAGSIEAVIAGLALNAFGNGSLVGVLQATVRDRVDPANLGAAMGKLATFGDLGSTCGPALAFALAPLAGLGAVYGLCIVLVGTALASFLLRGKKAAIS